MKKETVLKFLTTSCFLLPGNINSRKNWFLTPMSLLSLATLILVIMATITEFIGYQQFIRDDNIKEALTRLKTVPARPIGFCLRPLANNETLIEIEGEKGVTFEIVEVLNSTDRRQLNGTIIKSLKNASTATNSSDPHPTEDLEDIVSTALRFLIFGTNILIRIFIWFSFPSLIDLFTKVFHVQGGQQQEGSDPNKMKNRIMCHLWYEASQGWSTGEKAYLFIIAISQFQREVELIGIFYTSIANTGIDLLETPCLISQALLEQSKVLLSRELVLEIAAFVLVVIMKTFVNVIASISGGKDDNDPNILGQNTGFFLDEIGGGNKFRASNKFKTHARANMLFVRTRSILMKKEDMGSRKVSRVGNGISTIDKHISGIIGSPIPYTNKEPKGTFRISKQLSELYNGFNGNPADVIYSQINYVISMYFDLMGIWEQVSKFTGFVTLVLFCKLTTTFCFNTYITLDNSMNFGLFSGYGASGVMRGIVIITKFFCVCNAAQELRDMTPILLDHILKLKLKLLSLPAEQCQNDDKFTDVKDSPVFQDSGIATSQCERCRGLGSFLSEMTAYIRCHPFELSALGYFTVSRSTLTTISGVIVTYLVVLVQFQSYVASSSK